MQSSIAFTSLIDLRRWIVSCPSRSFPSGCPQPYVLQFSILPGVRLYDCKPRRGFGHFVSRKGGQYLQAHAGEVYSQLEATSKAVAEGVAAEAARAGVSLTTNRVGSMWTWFFTPGPVTTTAGSPLGYRGFRPLPPRHVGPRHLAPPSQFEAAFISAAHGDAEVQATIEAACATFTAG